MSDMCPETRTIGDPPLSVTLGCGRKPKHTGKHVTPEGDAEWWGPTDAQMAAAEPKPLPREALADLIGIANKTPDEIRAIRQRWGMEESE